MRTRLLVLLASAGIVACSSSGSNSPINGDTPSDQHACGSACVPSSSVATCGTRCTPCSEPAANGHAVCGGWLGALACGISCDDPAARVCGTECVSCPGASSFECGPTPGTCIATSCLAGYHRAGDACLPSVVEPV